MTHSLKKGTARAFPVCKRKMFVRVLKPRPVDETGLLDRGRGRILPLEQLGQVVALLVRHPRRVGELLGGALDLVVELLQLRLLVLHVESLLAQVARELQDVGASRGRASSTTRHSSEKRVKVRKGLSSRTPPLTLNVTFYPGISVTHGLRASAVCAI